MQETLNGELWVKYQEFGWLCTTRGKGGDIGQEQKFDSSDRVLSRELNSIFWSEEHKCWISSITYLRVPQEVTDWLRWQSLALFLRPSPKSGESDLEKRVEEVNDDVLKWSYRGRTFTCTCEPAVGGCIVFEAEVYYH